MCRAYPHTFFISFLFFELLCEFHLFVFGLKCAVRFFAAENNKLKVMKKKFILTVAFFEYQFVCPTDVGYAVLSGT